MSIVEEIQLVDNRLIPIGFVKSIVGNYIFYNKENCEFKIWCTALKNFYFLRLKNILLAASNNNSFYQYKKVSLNEILEWICSCEDINKLDMYLMNKENLEALEVLACRQ